MQFVSQMKRPFKPSKQETPKVVTLGVRVDAEMAKTLEMAARADGRTIANLVRRILSEWMAQHEKRS